MDPSHYAAIQDCAAANMLWEGGTHLPGGNGPGPAARRVRPARREPGEATADRWRAHYRAARRFRKEGIATVADEDAGAEKYVTLRRQWDNPVRGFAAYMEHSRAESDPPTPRRQAQRPLIGPSAPPGRRPRRGVDAGDFRLPVARGVAFAAPAATAGVWRPV